MSDVYSNAFNFTSFQDGKTDLRTGQFSAVVNLATIRPQGAAEGSREIKLVFSALTTTNAGYGIGWRLSESQVDRAPMPVVYLASGETYTAEALPPVGQSFRFKDLKLQNVAVVRTASAAITIYYIDGTVEVLEPRPSSNSPYRTVKLIFENGETFAYEYASAGTLARIVNTTMGQQEVLTLTCQSSVISKVRTRVQDGRFAEVSFSGANQLITSITVPYDNTDNTANPSTQPKYAYSYRALTPQKYQAISQIKNPMGGTQTIDYLEQGLQYQNNTYLPVVSRCETIPGAGQPSIVKRYTFSRDRNFTGYPFSGGFQPGRDNLYNVSGVYEYWGEETTIDQDANDAQIERVKSTFNKFHLMGREETQRGRSLTLREYVYNETPGASFPNQPANLQVPRQLSTTYNDIVSGASRSETLAVESDQYGNTLTKTESSGIRFEYEYYPISGDGALCPAVPGGYFVRYISQEKIVPADGGPARTTQTTYESMPLVATAPPVTAPGVAYFVLEKVSSSTGMVSTNRYVNEPAQPMVHGRPESTEVEIGGRHTSTRFTYAQSGTDLEERREVTGHDGTVTWASQKFSTVTDLLLQAQKAGEPGVVLDYDVMGRVVRQTVAPGTANAAGNTYVYHFASTNPAAPAWVEETDAKGRRYATRYDGMGRIVSAVQLVAEGQERRIKALLYDRLGNKAEESIYDQLEGEELTLRSRYEYNGWNELARTTQPDGSVTLSERDMVANTLTTGTQGLNTTINWYNQFNKPEVVTQAPTSGASVKTLERLYDGFGRCISATNVYGHRTDYGYDAFDRISEIRMQPADGSSGRTVTVSYADFSSADLPTEISVNGVLLGRRAYDGVGRMISTANGQAGPMTYAYDSGALKPSSSTSPGGIRLDYQYNNDLGTLTTTTSPSDGSCQYTYDPVSGQIADAQNSVANRQTTYDEYGAIRSERVTVAGQASEATYETSPAGRPLKVTTTLGGILAQGYDAAGRPKESAGGGFAEDIDYNSFGQIVSVRVSLAGIQLETALTYDGFGREATRTLRVQGSVWETIQLNYSASGQLIERITKDGTNALLSQERFTYDAYSRLIEFTCTGSRYPSDSQGRKLKSQRFTYDVLDNITRVESGYEDGTSNVSARSFSSVVPTQLVGIEETNPARSYSLSYDEDGNLSSDHQGRTYTYDQFGRLSSCSSAGFYGYDADGRLVTQTPVGAQPLQFFYARDLLTAQKQGETAALFHRDAGAVHGRTVRTGANTRSDVYGLDGSNSVIGKTGEDGHTVAVMYTPYGESGLNIEARSDDLATRPAMAFNGQRLDVLANLYHLGNGRRAYSPELMIFLSPDPLSPFSGGGLNAYGYCSGDPINMVDPSGLKGLLRKLVVAVVLFVAAVASAVATGGATIAVLGAIGAGLGVASSLLGITSAAIDFVDEKKGWDRSGVSHGLNLLSKAFGISSRLLSVGTSVGTGVVEGSKVTWKPGQKKASTRGQRIATGVKEGVKTLAGVGEDQHLTVLGVGAFAVRVINTPGDIKGIVENLQQQNGSDGSNGNNPGAVDQPASSGRAGAGGESGGSPYQPSFDTISDPITSLTSASEQYDQLSKSVRQSINSQLYYAES